MATTQESEPYDLGPTPDIDWRGVDRAQIRRMLAMSPSERLAWLEAFLASVADIRAWNEDR
jgi:hypothetical protein